MKNFDNILKILFSANVKFILLIVSVYLRVPAAPKTESQMLFYVSRFGSDGLVSCRFLFLLFVRMFCDLANGCLKRIKFVSDAF